MKRVVVLILALLMVLSLTACKSGDYNDAMEAFEAENYSEAQTKFEKLGDYKDSAEMVDACIYNRAIEYALHLDYDIALELLERCPGYKDSAQLILDYKYAYGLHLAGLIDPYYKPEIRESYTIKEALIDFYGFVGMNDEYQRDLEKALYIFTELSEIEYGYNVDHVLDAIGYILAVYGG